MLSACDITILISTHLILSLLFTAFRRPLEQFMAEELLALKGKAAPSIQKAFACRLVRMRRREALVRRMLRYIFPVSHKVLFTGFLLSSSLLWPLSLCLSLCIYAGSSFEKTPLMEICNDI
jgi:hypothetical protein